jgi:HPt (histidine-containing phosphotransfer) domain-containing protein
MNRVLSDEKDNDLPTLDMSIIQEIISLQKPDEPQFLSELISIFNRDSQIRIAEIKNAFHNKEYPTARDKVHGLKGLSGGLGARKLAFLCSKVEENLLTGEFELALTGFTHVEDELTKVRRELNHLQ